MSDEKRWSRTNTNPGCGPGKRVGIIGIGGLGHMGLMFARALGADKVIAISRNSSKKEDALKMGADDLIATEEEGWNEKHKNSLDIIISTVSSPKLPLMGYLDLLDIGGTFGKKLSESIHRRHSRSIQLTLVSSASRSSR
jgi:D-arabinose 1-dehydrogenase-like Zn-dependent alcohol dehydrogenase